MGTKTRQVTRTANCVTTTVCPTKLPKLLSGALKEIGCKKRDAILVVVTNPEYKQVAYNTRWDGGSHSEYGTYYIHGSAANAGQESLYRHNFREENETYGMEVGQVRVTLSFFCGEECKPVIHVLASDLPAFLGVSAPVELPAEIAADWMNERAESLSGRDRTKLETAAEQIREWMGLTAV